ncbi:protein FAM193A-like isoform X2 [Watersipora subatra]|uniref:protein FAM193A-like isoform X2 n=1 Tax=Watersipora subatra TaxID=2589382 RepID=UPI00355C51F9
MASTEAKKLRRKKTRRGREQENGSSRSPDASHSDLTNGSPGGASQRTVLSFTKLTDCLEGGLKKQNCSESNPLARNTPNEEHHQLRTGNFQNGSDENCCCESNKPVDPPDIYNEECNDDTPIPEDFSYPLHPDPEPDPLANNPYLNREKCLLCQRDRTEDDKSDSEDEELRIGPHNYALSRMSLWVCAKCKATLEEEERKGPTEPSFFVSIFGVCSPSSGYGESNRKICECEACRDRRQIELDQDLENAKLQQCWGELLHAIRCVYREGKSCLSENGGSLDKHKQKQHVSRLCARDAHQLYQRLESHAIDYILEVKMKELQHLMRFALTWDLHDKHLFHSVIYSDPVVQNSVPMLITQLRIGAATKEAYVEDSYPSLLHKYLKFDDEMAVVAVVWRDVQNRIELYNDEQAAVQAKRRMLREDWEFFSAQRKLLKDQVMRDKVTSWPTKGLGIDTAGSASVSSSENEAMSAVINTSTAGSSNKCLDAQFTEAMKSLFDDHTGARREPFTCPQCKAQICSCHECSISHLISCGVLVPELQNALFPMNGPEGSCGVSNSPFALTPSTGYDISVKAPSFSSTDSSSEADSDGHGSGYESTDSWDEKLKLNPNINLFEEFLKDAAREPPALRKENGEDAEKITPNNLSLPSPCQCHECKKPTTCPGSPPLAPTSYQSTSRASDSSSVPTSGGMAKPAALHLYPHIHGSKSSPVDPIQRGAAHLAAGGSLATAQYKSILQPQLYKLHSNPLHQSQIFKQLDKLYPKKESSAFSPPISSGLLQPCIKDQLKAQQWTTTSCSSSESSAYPFYSPLSGLKGGGSLSSTLNSYTNGLKFPELQSYSSTHRVSSDTWPAPPPPFNPSAFSLGSMTSANVSHPVSSASHPVSSASHPVSSASHPVSSAIRATKLHSWQKMAEQVQPSCLVAYPNALDSDTPHEHTDECFKYLNAPMPLPVSRHAPVSHTTALPTQSKKCTKVELDLYNKLRSGGFSPVTTCAATTTATSTSSASSRTIKNAPTVTACTARSTTQQTVTSSASSTAKTSASSKVSLNNSKSPGPSTCHHSVTPSKHKQVSGGKSSTVDLSKGEKVRHIAPHKPSAASNQSSGETEGGGSPLVSDEEDGGSCSGQSSSTSNSNQKDSKYCDCCYCEFFGHGQPTPTPTSKNYPEARDRLRLRLKKRQKDNPCAKGHDLVPISQMSMTPAESQSVRVARSLERDAANQRVALAAPSSCSPHAQKLLQEYPDVEELVKYITGEEAQSADTGKPDKKQRKKLKRAEQKARKLELSKQMTNVDSKAGVANMEGHANSDSEKIIAQEQGKSRHQRNNNNHKSSVTPDSLLPQPKKAKSEDKSQKADNSHQSSKPREPVWEEKSVASSTKLNNSQISKSGNSRSAKAGVTSSGSPAGDGQTLQQLNNTKPSGKADPQSGSVHQITHNDLQDGGEMSSKKSQLTSRANNKLADKKISAGERRRGDNLTENKKKGDGDKTNNMDEKRINIRNAKNSQSVSQKGSRRHQPDGQEDVCEQRYIRMVNGKGGPAQRRGTKGEASVDDVFMPRDDEEVEDSFEKELNEFKRFVMSTPAPRSKITANVNMKDLQQARRKV